MAVRKYAMKLNLVIDDIQKQPCKEMEVVKDALDKIFKYLNHPLNHK